VIGATVAAGITLPLAAVRRGGTRRSRIVGPRARSLARVGARIAGTTLPRTTSVSLWKGPSEPRGCWVVTKYPRIGLIQIKHTVGRAVSRAAYYSALGRAR
jgi:hypothetical protein